MRIFISHSNTDLSFVRQLADDLRHVLGSEAVWYDASLEGGEQWWRKIIEEIRHSTIFLIICSPAAMTSDWVNDEIDLAWRLKNSPVKMRIIPLLYQPCQLRDDLENLQFVRFLAPRLYKDGFQELLQTLSTSPDIPDQSVSETQLEPGGRKDQTLPLSTYLNNRQQTSRISRRTLLVGSAALVITTGGGLAWLALSRRSIEPTSPQNSVTIIPTPTSPPIPVGTIVTTYRGHVNSVLQVAWSPDSRRIASASQDSTVQIWWAALGSHMFTYSGHTSPNSPIGLAWSPDGKRIASASPIDVQIWDATLNATTSKPILTYRNPSGSIFRIAWSPDGSRIAVSDSNFTVQVFDAATGNTLQTYRSALQYVYGLAWSPDSIYLASRASEQAVSPVNANVQVWNTSNGKLIFTSVDPQSDGGELAWSPKGNKIAAGNGDPSPQTIVRILDATTGILISTYKGHTLGVNGLDWSPDGTYVASGSYDASVQIWTANNGKMVYRMNHSDSVFAVAWSPNGAFIASGGGGNNTVFDFTVKVWKAV